MDRMIKFDVVQDDPNPFNYELNVKESRITGLIFRGSECKLGLRDDPAILRVTPESGRAAIALINDEPTGRRYRTRRRPYANAPTCFRCDEYMTRDQDNPGAWSCIQCDQPSASRAN